MTTEKMKYYYQNGLWSRQRLEMLLNAGKITQEQFDEITADDN